MLAYQRVYPQWLFYWSNYSTDCGTVAPPWLSCADSWHCSRPLRRPQAVGDVPGPLGPWPIWAVLSPTHMAVAIWIGIMMDHIKNHRIEVIKKQFSKKALEIAREHSIPRNDGLLMFPNKKNMEFHSIWSLPIRQRLVQRTGPLQIQKYPLHIPCLIWELIWVRHASQKRGTIRTPVHPLVIAMPSRNKLTIQPRCWAHHFPLPWKLLENCWKTAGDLYLPSDNQTWKIHENPRKNIDWWDSQLQSSI